jgi:processive 1,2-diacylglycerol beta-glucosyltransferase
MRPLKEKRVRMYKKGISILYLSVGSGHQMAAESLANAIKQANPDLPVVAEDPFSEKTKILPKILNALQTISVTIAPDLYDLAWRLKSDYDSYQWLTDVGMLQDFLIDWLAKHNTDIIVATHVVPCILGVGLKRRSIVRNVYGVVTDFGAHSLWPTADVNRYFVASDELRNMLFFRGINSTEIHVTGIPIKKFPKPASKKSIGSKLRVLLTSGGIQSGSYTNVQRYASDLLDIFAKEGFDNIELTIVTGNQKQFRKELIKQVQNKKINARVLGFVQDMQRLMMKNDILITKPGGLIISEALAVGMCIILTAPLPGQERANANFLARKGAAFKGETPEEVAQVLRFLTENPSVIDDMKTKTRELGHPNSSDLIAKVILEDLK